MTAPLTPYADSARRWVETLVSFGNACEPDRRGIPTPMEFLLQHGRQFAPGPRMRRRRKAKRCFQNACHFARERGLVYVEGIASRYIPTEHAWCLDPATDTIIDPTWGHEGQDYFGVPIPDDVLDRVLYTTRVYGVLPSFWAWEEIHAILAAHFGAKP